MCELGCFSSVSGYLPYDDFWPALNNAESEEKGSETDLKRADYNFQKAKDLKFLAKNCEKINLNFADKEYHLHIQKA